MFRASRIAVRLNSTVSKAAAAPLSNAYVTKLEQRWAKMPSQDRSVLIAELKNRMALPWQELTPAEKKAAYYISFGEWGPRQPLYGPGDQAKVIWGVVGGIVALIVIYAGVLSLGTPAPASMTREWQEKSDEYLKSKNANPFSGYSQIQ